MWIWLAVVGQAMFQLGVMVSNFDSSTGALMIIGLGVMNFALMNALIDLKERD